MEETFPNYEDFEESLVAFIDLLGFDQRVKSIQNRNDFFEVGKLLYAINSTAAGLTSAQGVLKNIKCTAVSDSMIISVACEGDGWAVFLLQLLHSFQYELIATSFRTLVRGYINPGRVYHKDGLLFGPGYTGAYKGEKIIGHAPRIVLSPDVVKVAKEAINSDPDKEQKDTALNYLQKDESDGNYFIDYLKPVGSQLDLPTEQLLKERKEIKYFIEESLIKFKSDSTVLPKYEWLKKYFEKSFVYFS